MLTRIFPHGFKSRLSLRLLIYVVICSLFFSLMASALQLYVSYQRDLDTIQQNLQFIEESYLPAIANSAYHLNIEQIRLQLNSLLQFRDFRYIEMVDTAKRSALRVTVGNPDTRTDTVKIFQLAYKQSSGEKIVVGWLKIIASHADVYERLWGHTSVILLTTTVQIFLTTFFILLIIHWLITRHLITMARYVEQQDVDSELGPLDLNRKLMIFPESDELDQMVLAFNDLRVRVFKELENRGQVEIELRQSERKLKEAQEIARLGHWELDLKTNQLYWSDEIYRILELDPTQIEAAYDTFLDKVHPEDRQMVDQAYSESIKDQIPYNIVHRLRLNDGRIKTVRQQHRTDYDQAGNALRSIGTVQDITSQKEAEKELRLTQYAIDNSSTGIFRIGQDGSILYANQAACHLTGYSQQELKQMRTWDLDPSIPFENFEALWQELQTTDSVTFSGFAKTKDGRLIPLEINANLQEFEGEPYLFAYTTDITDRQAAERELQESERKLNAIINNHFQFTGLLNLEGRLLLVNRTAIDFVGKNQANLIGRYFWDTPWWNHSADVQQKLKEAINNAKAGELIRYTTFHPNSKGEMRDIDFSLKPIRDDNGQIIHLLAEGRDITEEKQTAEELKHHQERLEELVKERTQEADVAKETAEKARIVAETANRAKSAFLANMSHELRTPLNAIMGYSQLLQRDKKFTEKQKDRLSTINRSGKHLLALINDVLEMAKIESGHSEFLEQDVDLSELLQTLKGSFSLRAQEKGLNLSFSISPGVPRFIFTDEGKLRQILSNLLSNAVKFTDKGDIKIDITYDSSISSVFNFEVSDTGPGIQPEEMNKLFSAFEQTRTGKEKDEGTGLGLTISQSFARMMGGSITVESKFGVGSVFTLRIEAELPKSKKLNKGITTRRVSKLQPGQKLFKILVVDDQEDNRRILTNLLETVGFDVNEAENGRQGVALFHSWQPDLIFMDMRMPEMNGYEATRIIKEEGGPTPPPVIAVTASAFEEQKSTVLAAGCDEYIRKPILEEDIFNAVSKHLDAKFVYESMPAKLPSSQGPDVPLTAKSLSELPEHLLIELKSKTMELNQEVMQELIQKIRTQGFNETANGLERLVSEFQFEKIHELLN